MSEILPRLVLASASPRRRDILAGLELDFEVRPTHVDEEIALGESAKGAAERLALAKANALDDEHSLIVAADTLVVLDEEALGKPKNAEHARLMLSQLAGRDHEVVTGIAVRLGGRFSSGVARTRVFFAALSREDIAWYVATGEPMDKAGAYAIQGHGSLFVESIDGNYTNVVGLPIPLLESLLGVFGWRLRDFRGFARKAES